MRRRAELVLACVLSASLLLASTVPAPAQHKEEEPGASAPPRSHLSRVKHIIVVTQENLSFDNYFGVLPYAAGAVPPRALRRGGPLLRRRADLHPALAHRRVHV